MLTSVEAVVDAIGGNSAVAELASVGTTAVSNWKARRRIPPEKFLIIKRELGKRRMSADPALFGFDDADVATR